ncbi:MAG TPA: IS30 family transposase, partial [Patescibacteria group bacterium]|nr:IS30 family transposase [Patescibacteria group bacterium]
QKGGVENANKLIRHYLPRETNLSKLTDRDIYQIQEKLNNRPRKSLNYKTPNEVINNYLKVVHY